MEKVNPTAMMFLQASNLLYVDQPIGTGFSYSSDKRDIRHNEDGVSNDLYDFLQVCLFNLQKLFLRNKFQSSCQTTYYCFINYVKPAVIVQILLVLIITCQSKCLGWQSFGTNFVLVFI